MALGVAALAAALMMQAADPAAAAAAAKPAKAEKAKPEKVCVTEAQLGSHFKRKICATPEEWEKRRQRDQDEITRAQGNLSNN